MCGVLMSLRASVIAVLGLAYGCAPVGGATGGRKPGSPTPPPPVDGGTMGTPQCGVQQFMLQRGPAPDLLIVLDKSGSMNEFGGGGGNGSKWEQVRSALQQTVTALQMEIRWGLEFFPSDDDCGTQDPQVIVAPGNATAVMNAMSLTEPGGATPTASALQTAGNYLTSLPEGNPKYILLATDGQPNCGVDGEQGDVMGSLQAIQALSGAGLSTFVAGISLDADAQQVLNEMAMAGGQPRGEGPPYFYPVLSADDLVAAIRHIAGQIISCTFPLAMPPPDPTRAMVTAGTTVVPRDPSHHDGWDFGANNTTIQFFGEWCGVLSRGSVSGFQATFGCPPVGIAGPDPEAPYVE
jgi:hypothetical protein